MESRKAQKGKKYMKGQWGSIQVFLYAIVSYFINIHLAFALLLYSIFLPFERQESQIKALWGFK